MCIMSGLLISTHSSIPPTILLLLANPPKPKSRYEWEERFAFWQKPTSDTEEAKIESATREIKKALDKCGWLENNPYRIIAQGSYRNNTNVRNDSDVDLCVCLENVSKVLM